MSGFQRGSGFGTGGAWAPSSIGSSAELELHLLDIEGVDQTVTSGGFLRLVDHSGQAPNNPILSTHALTLNGTADVAIVGSTGIDVTEIKIRVKQLADNQEILTLTNATATAITVVAGTLTYGGSLTVSATDIDGTDYTSDLAGAGALLNDNAWHTLTVTLSAVTASDLRIGTDGSGFGNISVVNLTLNTTALSIPFCEGIGDTSHDTVGANHAALTLASEANAWANTQNVYDALIANGCTIARRFSGSGEYYTKGSRLTGTPTTLSGAAWVNPSANGVDYIFTEWLPTGNQKCFRFWRNSDTKLYLSTSDTGSADVNLLSDDAIPLDTWTHVAFTYNAGTAALYINGAAAATTGSAKATLFGSSTAEFVIAGGDGGLNLWNGMLTGIVVEEAEWTSSQVAALYAGTIPSRAWHFRDGDGVDVNTGVSFSATGTPDRVPIPSGSILPVTVGPGVLQPGHVIDLSGGDSGTAHAIALNAALGTLTYTYGDGDIGQNLHVRASSGGEDRLLVYDPQPVGSDLIEAQSYTA